MITNKRGGGSGHHGDNNNNDHHSSIPKPTRSHHASDGTNYDEDEEEDEFMNASLVRRRSVFNRPDLMVHHHHQHQHHQHTAATTSMTTSDTSASTSAFTNAGGSGGTGGDKNPLLLLPQPTNIEDMIYHGDNIRSLQGYKKSSWKRKMYYLSCVLSLGIVWMLAQASLLLRVKLLFNKCSLRSADFVLVKDYRDRHRFVKVKTLCIKEVTYSGIDTSKQHTDDLTSPSVHSVEYRMFEYNYLRYLYDLAEDTFAVQYLDTYEILTDIDKLNNGLDSQLHRKRLLGYGANSIALSAAKPKFYLKNFKREVLKPIYILQFALFIIWMVVRKFYFYGLLSLLITILVFAFVVYMSSINAPQKILAEWIKNTGREVRVIRDGVSYMVGSAGLVPGDVIEINACITLPCDLVLIRGSVEVDESALTGDTAHAQKISVFGESDSFNAGRSSMIVQQENTLVGGSKIISYKSKKDDECPLAVVIRTGFNTSRGRLIRQYLLSQEGAKEVYAEEISKFVITLTVIGLLSIIFTGVFARFGRHGYDMATYQPFLDLLLTICPPFIPLATWIPVYIASKNVKKGGIQRNGGGAGTSLMKFGLVDCICYDKTGTLTQSTLGLYGVLELNGKNFKDNVLTSIYQLSPDTLNVMASCHNLAKVNHVITGDKLEEELFNKTEYDLRREKNENVFIVHPPPAFNSRGMIQVTNVFPFSSLLQRASVVTRYPSFCVYSKGSPTSIRRICKPSTIPKNFTHMVRSYGLRGFRMIAFAKRELSDEMFFKNMTREDCEKDMTFLGFFVMKNHLHRESENEIIAMQNSKILTKMITGDSIYTAIAVAKECSMVDPLSKILVAEVQIEKGAVNVVWTDMDDGSTFRTIPPQDKYTQLAITGDAFSLLRNYCSNDTHRLMYQKLLIRCHIFGEMLPAQKAELINDLKDIDLYVAMVGDGANDSLALIASDVAFSLSEADTSFAAEFCADVDHCLSSFMIRQARALLDKIMVNFKFMILFVITQYTVALYNNIHVLKEPQVVWSGICGFLLLVTMSLNQPVSTMHRQSPPKTIMSVPFMASVILQAIIQIAFLGGSMTWMQMSQWFLEFTMEHPEKLVKELISSYLFLFSNFQYLAIALAFNLNCKYSKSLRNIFFLATFAFLLLFNLVILFPIPGESSLLNALQRFIWQYVVQIKTTDDILQEYAPSYLIQRWITLGLISSNFLAAMTAEFFLQRIVALYHRRLRRYRKSNLTYRKIMNTIPSMSKWL